MKNIKKFSAVTLLGLILLVFNACDDSSEKFEISSPTAPNLEELNFSRLELDGVNTNNEAITLNWTEATYGQPASINYAVQFSNDEAFTNFTTATSVTGKTATTLSVSEVNTAVGNAGLNPFSWEKVYIRVASSLGTQNSEIVNSNVISLEVYPYFNYVFNDYYLVGNGVAPGWNNNNNNPPLFRDANDENVYYYTGLLTNDSGDYNEGRFKVLETKGLWQPQWGEAKNEGSDDPSESGKVAGNPGTQSGDPGRFGVSTTGYYSFTIDFAKREYTLVPFNATGKNSPASLTLTGTSTADVTMNQLSFDGHIWYANNVKLTPGEVSFLTDAGANWGNTSPFSGIATNGGGNIPVVVEDNYDVWFNDLTGNYILIPLNL
ncbi:SusE domain-containing protein [Polaribacter tangerinus]|uniref:SusE domain-containing protein n=1 Tax=Polaribacter tangerinus TaxID=1920034 RepID=UPI000B4AD6AF|nr:SusE domain-containing protein [Polaribacter tangerinus]